MKLKKILISALLIMAFAVITVTPLLADNIILIQDSYFYSQNDTYITSQCATSAGEPQGHSAVAVAGSIYYGENKQYGPYHPMHSAISATQYIGNHMDYHCNSYTLENPFNN